LSQLRLSKHGLRFDFDFDFYRVSMLMRFNI